MQDIMNNFINSFEKLGYSLRRSCNEFLLFTNADDDTILIDFEDNTAEKSWCDYPVEFSFDEILILSDCISHYFKE